MGCKVLSGYCSTLMLVGVGSGLERDSCLGVWNEEGMPWI